MTFPEIHELETPRLRLRKLTREDILPYYQHIGSSEAVTRYMLFASHQDISESVASVEKALIRYEEGRCYRWCIASREDNSLMGIIELLRFDEENQSCSFAYMLGESFWGKGYGTEAVNSAFRFAFEQMGVQSITADHMTDNPASGAVMRKAGMVFQEQIPKKYIKNGICYDATQYTITREQWCLSHS